MDPETRVGDVMTLTVVTVTAEARLDEAARRLRVHHVSGLPVLAPPHRVVGMLSERDIVRSLHRATGVGSARGLLDLLLESAPSKGESILEVCRRQLRNTRVGDVMTTTVVTVARDTPLDEAARQMRLHGVKRLPVVDAHDELVGIVTRGDIVQAVSGKRRTRRGALRPAPAARAKVPVGPFEDV
ncbi:MAG TPA: CBS domain-containing protein [Thermoplasmata archaeon]|nr:CBS domain-containing protein [Thermoplasmata archaeon]